MTEVVALATVASCTLFFLIVLLISSISALGRQNSSTGRDTTKGGTRNIKGRPLSVTRLRPAGNLRRLRVRRGDGSFAIAGNGDENLTEADHAMFRREVLQTKQREMEASRTNYSSKEKRYHLKMVEQDEREKAKRDASDALCAEQEIRENTEFDSWKDLFTLESKGAAETLIREESCDLLQEFIDHIMASKVTVLEELAADFGLRTQDAVCRVQALEYMGRITGVLDDRGKFIFVSHKELRQVADYMKRRGRTPISDLAKQSNDFVEIRKI